MALPACRPHPTSMGIFGSVSKNTFRQINPIATRSFPRPLYLASQFSTATQIGPLRLRPFQGPARLNIIQKRTLFGNSGSPPTYHLSHLEQTANNNPNSASAQNAFYSACIRAQRPDIVVQRYETGKYATNQACDSLYTRALDMAGSQGGMADPRGQGHQHLSTDHLNSIGQAVTARGRNANVATAKSGSGAKDSPLYVVVGDTVGTSIFKFIKSAMWLGVIVWVLYVFITLLVEASGMLKKVSGAQNVEAKPELQTTRFSDVHGCDEAKEELQELVEFLKAPDKFNTLGGKLPKGILLVGPPGTGKTLLARAVAGEAGVPFFYMSGSEFDEVYVGVGAKRIRELFNAARSKAPAIVFIDELDAIGGKRNERDAAYSKQTLNQLLTDLDGFDQNSGVIFLAATNFPELLDKALTRPGRFDRNVAVPLPDVRGRVAIVNHHMRNIQIGTDVDAAIIARGTPGFSGAELENIVNQAAVHASKNKQTKVHMNDFEWAKDRVLMGAERRSAVITPKDRLMTAYHEGGHALVAMFTKSADPLYKATIMPRGHALGITFQLPEMDRVSMAKREYLAHLDVCMGGKMAEELVYGPDDVSSGASSDIASATRTAYNMVTMMGMSDTLGNVDLHNNYNLLSNMTRQHIDEEVRRLVDEAKERAKALLTEKRKELDLLAEALVEYESLNREEMEKVVRGEKLPDKLKSKIDKEPPTPPGSGMKIPELILPGKLGGPPPTASGTTRTGLGGS
ncbi:putative mitochondrial inner membrane i-AAA protease supercomplex subunit YME1 [Aulographum hederae CBS 113979]|uniref:Putative mitochondrial inner membrane i-AAA protease supercomplex subunit YME1 n=1 Tax=Aulographum hederae CBS 113979 TaxID=1176131 RepID=A0A6G1GTU2_9PEZI|nr:putative mitochondrial inner membrane i-AAA protease supercomplex subunit YME1 [Aulographum hederae CBS 113979]